MTRTSRLLLLPLAVLGLVGAACGSSSSSSGATTTGAATTTAGATTTHATPVTGIITVFAAASLTAAFNEVGTAFAATYPDAKATFSYDASSALVAQIIQGALADVFASADEAN